MVTELIGSLLFISLLHLIGSISERCILPLYIPLLFLVIQFASHTFPLLPYYWEISVVILLSIGITLSKNTYNKIKDLWELYKSLPPPPVKQTKDSV